MKHNQKIRDALRANGIRQWELADKIGLHENSLSRLLRYKLSNEKTGEILLVIKKMAISENN